MFEVTHGKVKYKGDIYGKSEEAGDVISGLTAEQEESLAKKGYGKIIQETVDVKSTNNKKNKKPENPIIPDDLNVGEVVKMIEKTENLETLYQMYEFEEASKNRKGVIDPLGEKIEELQKESAEEFEGEGDPVDIDINLDPDDLIQDDE